MSNRGSPSGSSHSDFRNTPGAFPGPRDYADDDFIASDPRSLSRAVKARSAEYTRRRKVRIKIGTWNVAALPGPETDIGSWFVNRAVSTDNPLSLSVSAAEDVEMYVLGLQEIVDIASHAEALRPYVDPAPSNKWKEAVKKALPPTYELISAPQLVGLLLLIYATPSLARAISSISTTYVGTGLIGYMGNKGAVATRIVIGGTTRLAFINCHLAAGADKASLDRRNWDASQILSRTKFDPVQMDDDVEEDTLES